MAAKNPKGLSGARPSVRFQLFTLTFKYTNYGTVRFRIEQGYLNYKVLYERLPYILRQKIQFFILRSVGGKRLGFFIRSGISQKS